MKTYFKLLLRDLFSNKIFIILHLIELILIIFYFMLCLTQIQRVIDQKTFEKKIGYEDLIFFNHYYEISSKSINNTLSEYLNQLFDEQKAGAYISNFSISESIESKVLIGCGNFSNVYFSIEHSPDTDILISRDMIDFKIGDTVNLMTPNGNELHTITGYIPEQSKYLLNGSILTDMNHSFLFIADSNWIAKQIKFPLTSEIIITNFFAKGVTDQELYEIIDQINGGGNVSILPRKQSYPFNSINSGILFYLLFYIAFGTISIISIIHWHIKNQISKVKEYKIHLIYGAEPNNIRARALLYTSTTYLIPACFTLFLTYLLFKEDTVNIIYSTAILLVTIIVIHIIIMTAANKMITSICTAKE